MNFSAWAIRKPTPSVLLFFMITVAGLVAFQRLGVQSFPNMELPGGDGHREPAGGVARAA